MSRVGRERRQGCKAEAVCTPGQGPSLVGARHPQLLAQNGLCHGPAIHQQHSQDAEILPELRLFPILCCSGIVLIICIFLRQLFLVGFVPVVIFHWDKETTPLTLKPHGARQEPPVSPRPRSQAGLTGDVLPAEIDRPSSTLQHEGDRRDKLQAFEVDLQKK